MEHNQQAYNAWAEQYDTNKNNTRDLEAIALREILTTFSFTDVLEIGCGTGKNSAWLVTKATNILAVDFSEEMLKKAKDKINNSNIVFQKADITKPWSFTNAKFSLIIFSLVLEHTSNLGFIFSEARKKIKEDGYVYIGELHPVKQHMGSLARFETNNGRIELDCFTHNISEFLTLAEKNGFSLVKLDEWFDKGDERKLPRILTLLFRAG